MFEKIQKGVYNLPLDISNSSSNLKAAHNFIKSGEVLIFRNAVNKDLVNSIKAHLIALADRPIQIITQSQQLLQTSTD